MLVRLPAGLWSSEFNELSSSCVCSLMFCSQPSIFQIGYASSAVVEAITCVLDIDSLLNAHSCR